jgi:hypothetical protein
MQESTLPCACSFDCDSDNRLLALACENPVLSAHAVVNSWPLSEKPEASPEQEPGSASRIDTTEDHSLVQRPSYLGDLPAELKIRPAAVVDPNTTTIETPTVALPAWRVTALLQ